MKSHEKGERMIDKAIRSLRLQRIPIKCAGEARHDRAQLVDGVLLTNAEIVDLYRRNRLTRWGIREHAKAAGKGS